MESTPSSPKCNKLASPNVSVARRILTGPAHHRINSSNGKNREWPKVLDGDIKNFREREQHQRFVDKIRQHRPTAVKR